MAAYYYVKDTGTSTTDTGRYATQQTGTFAGLGTANYYASIETALAATTAPVAGDFILISDLSTHTYGAGDKIINNGLHLSLALNLLSVDDGVIENYKKATAAQEKTPNIGDDFSFRGCWAMYGVYLSAGQNLQIIPDVEEDSFYAKDCKFEYDDGENLLIGASEIANSLVLQSCQFDASTATSTNQQSMLLAGGICELQDCAIGSNTVLTARIIGLNASPNANVSGLDTSSIGGTPTNFVTQLIDEVGTASFVGCQVHSNVSTIGSGVQQYAGMHLQMDYVANNAETGEEQKLPGSLFEQPDVTRTGGSSNSWKIVTTQWCDEAFPFRTPWITGYFDSTAAKTVDIYIANETATDGGDYNNDELWLELEYFGAAGNALYDLITTARATPFATAANPHDAADGSTWSGGTAPFANMHILRGSCTPGQVGPFRVRLCFGRASVTTDALYVDPLIVVT